MLLEMLSSVIDLVAGVFAGFLLLRFWMQTLRLRPPSSLGQPMFQITDWIVLPIRRIVPGFGGLDWASLIAAFLVALVSNALLMALSGQQNFVLVLVISLTRLLHWMVYGLMGLLLLEVVFSFVNPYAPLAPLVRALNEPFLAPIRKLLPPLGGFDFSVLVAFLLLQFFDRFVTGYLARLLYQSLSF